MVTDKALPREKESDARIPLSHTVISSASEKSFSFAVKKKQENIGKRETPYSIHSGITAFHSRRKKRAVNEKSTLGGTWEANLRPFGAPPSIGRRESRVSASLPHTVISGASEKSFSFAVKKKQENIGKRETRYAIRSWLTAFHLRRKQRAVNEKLSRRRL